MKKTLSFLMVLAMLVAMMVPALAETADAYGRYAEPVKITILSKDFKTGTTAYDSSDATRRSATENNWITAYKDYLNIEVERIIAEDDTALNAKISTSLASGDLPDFIICDKAMAAMLIENEVVQDLQPALDAYAEKNYLADCLDPAMFTYGIVDGKMLAFPITNNWYNSTQLLWVRQDWLDQVGKTVPTTIDELIDVARAFRDAKLGGEDTVPLGMDNDNSSYDYRWMAAAYGAVYDTWQVKEDGTYEYGCVNAGMEPALLKLQEMYKEGLMAPDFATGDSLSEDIANSRCGMYFATGWHSVTDLKTNMVNDEKSVWVCAAMPTLDGERVKQYTNGTASGFVLCTEGCENPEAIFKMMELEQQVYINPTDEQLPVLYTAEDGFLMWDLRIFRNFGRTDFDLYRSELINGHLAAGHTSAEVEPVIYDFYTQIEKALAGDRSLLGRYICQKDAYPIDAELLAGGWLCPAYGGPLTENMMLYEDSLYADLNAAMVKVIMGEDISVWTKAVEAWYANGGQDITDEVTEYYKSL